MFHFSDIPIMPRYISGPNSEAISQLIDVYVQTNKEINEILLEMMNDNSSSDDSTDIPRPMYTREYTGRQYVNDVLAGHPTRAYNCFRLPADAFVHFRDILMERGLIKDTRNMTSGEQLAIFLRGVAHAHSYRQLCEFFQHSLETISRYFNIVLKAVVQLREEYIKLPLEGSGPHPFVGGNPQFNPYFRNAVGAIDGTHIPAIVGREAQNRYRNRKGFTSQNVMAAVSFDRQFVFVAAGWEGSAADMRVLRWAIDHVRFSVPNGHYYLVDSGYANTSKFIAPFRGYRYHLSEYQGGGQRRYTGHQEYYTIIDMHSYVTLSRELLAYGKRDFKF